VAGEIGDQPSRQAGRRSASAAAAGVVTYGMIVLILSWGVLGPPAWNLTDNRRLLMRFACVGLGVFSLRLNGKALALIIVAAAAVAVHGLSRLLSTGTPHPYHWYELALASATLAAWIPLPRRRPVTRSEPVGDSSRKEPPVAGTAEARSPVGRLRPSPDAAYPRGHEGVVDPDRLRPFGRELADAVADLLEAGGDISYRHRDHCGMGLALIDGVYVYDEVSDGQFCHAHQGEGLEEAFAAFFDRASFVTWLGFQDDESLSGRESGDPWYTDNQRITRERLNEEVRRRRSRTSAN
jgi:hypothetical protein